MLSRRIAGMTTETTNFTHFTRKSSDIFDTLSSQRHIRYSQQVDQKHIFQNLTRTKIHDDTQNKSNNLLIA